MRRISSALLAAALIGIAPAAAGEAGPRSALVLAQATEAAAAAEFSAQRRVRRKRTRLRVTPLRGAYRQCVDWYRVEHRLSGTVITPQMRCWWVGG
jgi:hypothetical protein